MSNKGVIKVTIACAFCPSTITLRKSKVQRHAYYACGPCDRLGRTQHPPRAEGEILEIDFHAAGSFTGYTPRMPTNEERASVERAKAIRDRGMALLDACRIPPVRGVQ